MSRPPGCLCSREALVSARARLVLKVAWQPCLPNRWRGSRRCWAPPAASSWRRWWRWWRRSRRGTCRRWCRRGRGSCCCRCEGEARGAARRGSGRTLAPVRERAALGLGPSYAGFGSSCFLFWLQGRGQRALQRSPPPPPTSNGWRPTQDLPERCERVVSKLVQLHPSKDREVVAGARAQKGEGGRGGSGRIGCKRGGQTSGRGRCCMRRARSKAVCD